MKFLGNCIGVVRCLSIGIHGISRVPSPVELVTAQEPPTPINMTRRGIAEWILSILIKGFGLKKPGEQIPDQKLKKEIPRAQRR
jgi:hypothetical protein